MNFDWFRKERETGAWEKGAKENNPNYKKTTKFFVPPAFDWEYESSGGGTILPIDTKEGFDFYKGITLLPWELIDKWLELHPNQKVYNSHMLKILREQKFISDEFWNEIQPYIVEVPDDMKSFTKTKENTFVLEELNVDLRLPITYKIEDKNIRDITITEVFDLMLKNGFNIDTFDKYKNMINIRFLKEHTEVLFLFKNNKCVDFTSDGILPESLGIII